MAAHGDRELELKLTVDDDGLKAVARSGALAAMRLGPPRTRRLRAIYFDTRDRRLAAAGIGLRVRQEDGAWVQTLKIGSSVRFGISNPIEAEWPVPQPRPNLDLVEAEPLRDALVRALGTRQLRQQFETVIVRETCLAQPAGGGIVEIAVDHGQVHADTGEDIVREIEIELKDGEPSTLLAAAEAIFTDIPFRLGLESKAERGYRLLAGTPRRTLSDTATSEMLLPDLSSDMPARTALEAIGAAYGEAALAFADLIVTGESPKGPHQLRVHLRRLRTLIAAFRSAFDGPRMRRITDDAKRLGRTIGPLRDADVLSGEVVPAAAEGLAPADRTGLAPLVDALHRDRTAIRATVRASLAGPRWSWLTLQLALFALAIDRAVASGEGPGADGPVGAVADRALRRAFKKVGKYGKRLETLTIEERHDMRKALKALRYTIEVFAPLYPEEAVAAYVRQLRKMQDVFGYLNDVETARHCLAVGHGDEGDGPEAAPAAHSSPPQGLRLAGAGFELAGSASRSTGPALSPVARTAAAIVAHHERRSDKAWEAARRRWRALKAMPRFWQPEPA